MKKILVSLVLIIFSLSFILAITGNIQNDKFYDSSTGSGLTNVQSLLYRCNDNSCNSIGTQVHSINSGSKNNISFEYPYNPSSTNSNRDYYAHFIFKQCYNPKEYIEDKWGYGVTFDYNYNFNKKTSCYSPIKSFSIINSQEINQPIIINVKADIKASATQSAFTDSQFNYIPVGYEDYYSAETKVILKIFNKNNNVIWTDTKIYKIMQDTSQDIQFKWTPDIAGDFRAVLTTDVIDCRCQSSSKQSVEKQFSVFDSRPEEECYTLINDLTTDSNSVEAGDLVNIKFKKISNYADRDSQLTPVPTSVKYEITDSNGNIVYSKQELLTANSDDFNAKEISFQWRPDFGGDFKIKVTGVSSDNLCHGKTNPEDTAFMDLFVESPRIYDVMFYVKDRDKNPLKNAKVKYGSQTGIL